MIDILISLVIAGIAGAIAKTLVGLNRGGCIISIIVGFIGAMIGTWLARDLNPFTQCLAALQHPPATAPP